MAKSKAEVVPTDAPVPPDAAYSIRAYMAVAEQENIAELKMRYHDTPPPDVLERVAAEKQIAKPDDD